MRRVNEEQLAAELGHLADGQPKVLVAGNFATPWTLLAVLDRALPAYRLMSLNAQGSFPDRDGVTLETPFVGPAMRGRSRLRYLPMRLSLVPQLIASSWQPDVVLVQVSPPSGTKVSLGVEVNILPSAIEVTRRRGGIVVAQVNRWMPYTFGDGELEVEDVDLALERDEALPTPPASGTGDVARTIGERVSRLAEDGSTLQAGIGAVPDATLGHLTARRGLGVWSEMVSDGILRLERAGALDPGRVVTASFLFGSQELYEWADRNERLVVLRTETTNDPVRIAANPAMLSVNSALQVDLFAQANASWVRGEVYSGFGGQTDFTVGALHSPGGHAVIALPSWHPKADLSSVVPVLEGPVTSFQHSAIVTEQGCALLFGRSQREQASAILEEAAHPDARERLRTEASRLGL